MSNEVERDVLPSDLKLWRYMSLPQLLALLTSNSLWFSRLDKFDDPTEGSWARGTLEAWTRHNPTIGEHHFLQVAEESLRLREQMYASCWHANDDESLDMWRLYCLKNQGVAVETTYGQLKDAISSASSEDGDEGDEIIPGRVVYVDFRTAAMSANMLAPAFYKQDGFASEREIRLLIWRRGSSAAPPGAAPDGISIPALMNNLVNTIWIGPFQPTWLRGMLQTVVPTLLPSVRISTSRFDLS